MKNKKYKTQADLFSFVLDKYVEDEETCISEWCIKNKSQAYENLKIKRNNLAEEWNRLTKEREEQIRVDERRKFAEFIIKQRYNFSLFNKSKDNIIIDIVLEEYEKEKQNER